MCKLVTGFRTKKVSTFFRTIHRTIHTKAHTFASRTSPSTDQSLQKSVLFANPKRNSFFSSLPSVFYFFATHYRHQNGWTETAKTFTGQGLTMTEGRRPACNMGLASCGVKCLNSSAVFQINFSAGLTVLCPEIPHERQSQNG
jgi:hypothetical protein